MKLRYLSFNLLLLLFIPLLVYAQKAPDWYTEGSLIKYPKEMYITGVGAGETRDAATNAATEAIAKQLRVDIESKTESVTREIVRGDETAFMERFESAIETTVDETVTGAQVVKEAQEGDTHYAFAVLDKSKFLNSLREQLSKQEETVNNLVNEARKLVEEGKIVAAADNYGSAQEIIPKFYSDKTLYDAISNTPYELKNQFSVEDIDAELRDLLSYVDIEVTSGQRQQAKAGEPLPGPIEFMVRYRKRGKEIPLSDVIVTASYEKGQSITRVKTDENGKAAFLAEAVPPEYGDRGKIELKPWISSLPSSAAGYMRNASTVVRYSVSSQMPLMMSVDIKDENGEPLPAVNDKVTRSLERLGHTVQDNAPLKLKGTVRVIERSDVETMGETQTLVRAQMDAKLTITSSGEVVGSFSNEEKGLSSRGEQAAMKSAYNRMDINKREFSQFLARSEDKLSSIFGNVSKEKLAEGKKLYEAEKYREAIDALRQVVYGEELVQEARDLMKKALAKIQGTSSFTYGNSESPAGEMPADKALEFGQYSDGDLLKQYGNQVVVKTDEFGNKFATVFKNGALFEVNLPQNQEIEVTIVAKIHPERNALQSFALVSDRYEAEMIFNKSWYRRIEFGSTLKDIDQEDQYKWDNEGKNRIRFQVTGNTVKGYINYKFFGARQIEGIGSSTRLRLKLHQNDAIYRIAFRKL